MPNIPGKNKYFVKLTEDTGEMWDLHSCGVDLWQDHVEKRFYYNRRNGPDSILRRGGDSYYVSPIRTLDSHYYRKYGPTSMLVNGVELYDSRK